ncbi:MAG: hypothetical protein AB8G99_04470 [Planctomycetaceae bacterium]
MFKRLVAIMAASVFVLTFAINTANAQSGHRHTHGLGHAKKTYTVVNNGYTYRAPSHYRAAPVRRVQRASVPVVQYVFGKRRHLDELADRLNRRARNVLTEMQPYRHEWKYRAAYRRMYDIYRDTQHIQTLVRQSAYGRTYASADQLARDLHHIDQLWHDSEFDLNHLAFGVGMMQRRKQFGATLHHLMDDYGVRSRLVLAPVVPDYYGNPYIYGTGISPY